jgi:hypothetical protein
VNTPSARTAPPPASGTSDGLRYLLSLGLLLLTLVTFALAEERGGLRILALAVQGLTVFVVLWSAHAGRRVLAVTATLVATGVVVTTLAVITGHPAEAPLVFGSIALLALLAPVAIVRHLLSHEQVRASTVFGALCLYVVAGLLFASVYRVLDGIGTGGFFAQTTDARTIDFIYFSFVTLATLGYGDLTPQGDIGRMLAVIETMLGQLYLVGVVAILVSNLGFVRPRRRAPSED